MTGSNAFFIEESSPSAISRLISRPTVKKKNTIRMSLMNFSMVMSLGKRKSICPSGLAKCTWTAVSRKSLYNVFVAGRLASNIATITQIKSNTPWNQGAFDSFLVESPNFRMVLFQVKIGISLMVQI